ncbi:MAG: S9 family peptidase, partial [Phycisphaerales bacterium]
EKKDEGTRKDPARVVHRFLHSGGPTTPRMIRPYYLADNRRIVYMSEKTGFRQLHVLDPVYESDIPLTQGHFEVYPLDITEDHKWMFVTATKEHPAHLDVYKVSLEDGEMTRLSQKEGYYADAAVSPDGTNVLANFTRYGAPRELVFIDAEANKQTQLTDSHPPAAHENTKARPEFFSYQNRHEQEIHGLMFKPEDPNQNEKPPLLIYIYGGPLGTRKSVVEGNYHSSAYFFAYYMSEKHGYVTCTIDPRGNSGYGGLFEKANFDQVGKPQVEDIVDGAKYFIEKHNVDPNRVAIHGWSFGGFQTQMCLYTEPGVFAAGIAGAGPTEWENYNSWYTSGTIGISEPNTAELKKFSLLPLAKGLKAKLLLVHGMEDSNVLYQDTVRMYRELIKAGKETLVELFLDPTGGHALGGDVKRLSRYRKYEEFLLRTVGSGK